MDMSDLVEHGIKGRGPGYFFTTTDYGQLQAILVLSGCLRAEIAGVTHDLTPGLLLWLPPGSSFTLSCQGCSYRGVFAIRRGDKARDQARVSTPVPQLAALAEAMCVEASAPAGASAQALTHLAEAFLILAGRVDRTEGAGDAWAERLRLVIGFHLSDQTPVRELCSSWPISYRQLARRFTSAFGASPKAWQLTQRLVRARTRLADSRLSITDIALEHGFASSQHFASSFRRHFGATPRTVRPRAGS